MRTRFAVLALAAVIGAGSPLAAWALPKDASFKAEGPDYIAEASGDRKSVV